MLDNSQQICWAIGHHVLGIKYEILLGAIVVISLVVVVLILRIKLVLMLLNSRSSLLQRILLFLSGINWFLNLMNLLVHHILEMLIKI